MAFVSMNSLLTALRKKGSTEFSRLVFSRTLTCGYMHIRTGRYRVTPRTDYFHYDVQQFLADGVLVHVNSWSASPDASSFEVLRIRMRVTGVEVELGRVMCAGELSPEDEHE